MYKRFFAMRLSLICIKKYFCLLFLLTLFCSINPAFCADNLNTKLNEIEMNYYGYGQPMYGTMYGQQWMQGGY